MRVKLNSTRSPSLARIKMPFSVPSKQLENPRGRLRGEDRLPAKRGPFVLSSDGLLQRRRRRHGDESADKGDGDERDEHLRSPASGHLRRDGLRHDTPLPLQERGPPGKDLLPLAGLRRFHPLGDPDPGGHHVRDRVSDPTCQWPFARSDRSAINRHGNITGQLRESCRKILTASEFCNENVFQGYILLIQHLTSIYYIKKTLYYIFLLFGEEGQLLYRCEHLYALPYRKHTLAQQTDPYQQPQTNETGNAVFYYRNP